MASLSTAVSPDLDWSQVRETVRMLFLAVAQIEIALRESDDSVQSLTDTFTSMMAYEKAIGESADQLPEDDTVVELKEAIKHRAEAVSTQMQSAIIAFQFYDKLTQRLGHVATSIESLSNLVGDQSRLFNPNEWNQLQGAIRSRYSMREEHEMFDAVMQGADVRDAVRRYNESHKQDLADDIEFF